MTTNQIEAMKSALQRIADMDGRTILALRKNEEYVRGAEDAFAEVAGIAQRTLEALGGE